MLPKSIKAISATKTRPYNHSEADFKTMAKMIVQTVKTKEMNTPGFKR